MLCGCRLLINFYPGDQLLSCFCKLSLAQMVRFFVIELIYPDSNPRFDVCVIYLRLIIFSEVNDILVDSEAFFDRFHESQDQVGSVFQIFLYE
jgi:hypothetical protein